MSGWTLESSQGTTEAGLLTKSTAAKYPTSPLILCQGFTLNQLQPDPQTQPPWAAGKVTSESIQPVLSHLCSFIYTLYVSKLGWRKIGPVPHVCQQMIILITASAQHFVPCEEAHFPFLIYYFWEEGLDLFPRSVMFFIWALGKLLPYATSWGYLLSFWRAVTLFSTVMAS